MVIYGQQKLPIRFLMPLPHTFSRSATPVGVFDVLCFLFFAG